MPLAALRAPVLVSAVAGALLVSGCTGPGGQTVCPPAGFPQPPGCEDGKPVAGGLSTKVTFIVSVPEVTPDEDTVYIHTLGATKMTKINKTAWTAEVMLPPFMNVTYGYTRNKVGYETSEEVTSQDTWDDWFKKRSVRYEPPKSLTQHDVIKKWRWLSNEPTKAAIIPDTKEFVPRVSGWKFQKGIGVIDYWWNVFFDNNETENTVKQIVEDRANYVHYRPSWVASSNPKGASEAEILSITDEPLTLLKIGYPDRAIQYEVRTAKSAGLKVIFRNQVWMDLPPEVIQKNRSAEWWAQYYNVRREYLLGIARVAQEEGVEAMSIGAGYDTLMGFTTWGAAPSESWTKWIDDIQEVKKIYKGKIYYDFVSSGKLSDSFSIDLEKFRPILAEIDFIGITWSKGLSDKDNPTLEELKKNAKDQFDKYLKPIYEAIGKPIVIVIAYPSADGGSTGKYAWNSRPLGSWKPDDGTYNDFQEQAEVYEAIMGAIADRPWIVGGYTDAFLRRDQQDKSSNIRGKPAEEVLKKWYGTIPN